MAKKKVGDLIKEARTGAGLTQDQLAKKVDGLTAADISKAERGEKEFTQAQLKQIAKATGVTQKSLLEAPKGASGTTAASSAGGTGGKGKTTSMKVTAAEKKLLELYRAADAEKKKAALKALKGDSGAGDEMISAILENAMDIFLHSKK